MVKIQFMKLKISNYCCSSQIKNETSIVEWCIMDREEFHTMLAKELNFEKYVQSYDNPEKLLKKLHNRIVNIGRVRSVSCENCRTIYLFQSMQSKLSDRANPSLFFGDFSLWLKSDKILTIEQLVEELATQKN